jgi:hypothetical protein
MRPDYEEYKIRTLFTLIDADGNGLIDEGEFDDICDTLFLTVSKREGVKSSPFMARLRAFIESNSFAVYARLLSQRSLCMC